MAINKDNGLDAGKVQHRQINRLLRSMLLLCSAQYLYCAGDRD